ncbi:MAG TPA: phosphatidylserine/phosphatidylglycerophosphate/cardiolipin synthase family protein [Candidatus Saccharimonadia bacterium]
MTTTTKLNYVPGNRVATLLNAVEAYPVMLRAIHNATTSIYIAHFCYQKGKASDLFYQPLLTAARRGVKIYLLIDAYGSNEFDRNQLKKMRLDHINVRWFNPRKTLHPLRYNKRMHKKLLIIDNSIGFSGGIGIADFWLDDPSYPEPWRDTHFQLEGPVISELSHSFITSWNRFSSEQLPLQKAEPAPVHGGTIPLALVDTAPIDPANRSNITNVFTRLIGEAKGSIDISTAYFGPTAAVRRSLHAAAKRGVSVRIITNGPHPSHWQAMQAGRHHYNGLLEAGVDIFEYQRTKIHAKITIIDRTLSIIGSSNLNTRSFHHDEEAIMVADDMKLATGLTKQFEDDLESSKPIELKEWRQRPLTEKLQQAAASIGRYFF